MTTFVNKGEGRVPSAPRLYRTYNLYLRFRSILAEFDLFYPMFIGLVGLIRPNQRDLRATKDNDIVIDGFPRSANTYFVSFFEVSQRRPLSIGRHLHESWQFRFAERHNIPCVVLVRDPLAAVSSALLRDSRAKPETLLANYTRLYRNVLRYRRKSVIAPFEIVVSDANAIIEALNRSYGISFSVLPLEKRGEIASEVEAKDRAAFGKEELDPVRIAAPSKEKKVLGDIVRREIEENHGALLNEAQEVYRKVLSLT